ncbi:transglycosylase SLT domain-containing protein [uncultured Roseobacter sp.]|uniref:transglycosylase SLT domain-containing protein n=1 Tax=uncultured Roseobacter sp. TaxID=114847 RepID=UPI0026042DFB|nr:transglycosylase SLT domain-containing protein [uncultured Roseobacter sp.]
MKGQALAGLARNLDFAAANLDLVAEQQKVEEEEAQLFEADRQIIDFEREQREIVQAQQDSTGSGAFGYSEKVRADYIERAKQFRKSLPEGIRQKYDVPLFALEDKLYTDAVDFERTARRLHFGAKVDDGLAEIEGQIFAKPDSYDENLRRGVEFIKTIPNSGFTQLEKEERALAWERSAKLAVLNGVSPEERIRLLGGVSQPDAFNPSQGLKTGITKGIKGEVRTAITSAAQRHGVDPEAMLVVAWLESRGDPNAKNPNSSAGGLFQQIDSNAAQYGVQDRMDANQSADGAARFMADNRNALRRVLGREPTIGELYLAHQQGAGGATKLLTNPNARAADLVGDEAVRLNGGEPDMTAGEFAQLWLKKAGDTHVPDGGLMGAAFNPEAADPRFRGMDYIEATEAIEGAQKQISAIFSEQEQKIAAERSLADAQLGVAVTDGEATQADVDNALRAGVLTDKRWEALSEQIIKRDRENAKKSDNLRVVTSLIASGSQANGFNPEHREGVDQIDAQLSEKFGGDSNQLSAARLAVVRETGVAPSSVVQELSQGIALQDASAFALAGQMQAEAPSAFQGVPNGQRVRDAIGRYTAFTNAGYPPEEAARLSSPTPEEARQLEAVNEVVNEEMKEIDARTVTKEMAGLWGFGEPDVAPASAPLLLRDFETIYRKSRADGMPPDVARAYTIKRLIDPVNGLYGVSEIASGSFDGGRLIRSELTADSALIRNPPEHSFPPINGSHEYLQKDLQDSLSQLLGDSSGDYFLVPEELETGAAVNANRAGRDTYPGYALWVQINGAWEKKYWRMTPEAIEELQQAEMQANEAEFNQKHKVARVTEARRELTRKGLNPNSPEWLAGLVELLGEDN